MQANLANYAQVWC